MTFHFIICIIIALFSKKNKFVMKCLVTTCRDHEASTIR